MTYSPHKNDTKFHEIKARKICYQGLAFLEEGSPILFELGKTVGRTISINPKKQQENRLRANKK